MSTKAEIGLLCLNCKSIVERFIPQHCYYHPLCKKCRSEKLKKDLGNKSCNFCFSSLASNLADTTDHMLALSTSDAQLDLRSGNLVNLLSRGTQAYGSPQRMCSCCLFAVETCCHSCQLMFCARCLNLHSPSCIMNGQKMFGWSNVKNYQSSSENSLGYFRIGQQSFEDGTNSHYLPHQQSYNTEHLGVSLLLSTGGLSLTTGTPMLTTGSQNLLPRERLGAGAANRFDIHPLVPFRTRNDSGSNKETSTDISKTFLSLTSGSTEQPNSLTGSSEHNSILAQLKSRIDVIWQMHEERECKLRIQFSDCRTQVESYFQAIKAWQLAFDKLLAAEAERRVKELNKQRELFLKQLMEESWGSGNELMQVLRGAVNNLEDLQATDSEEFDVRLPDFTKLLESVQTTLVDPSRCRILAGLNIRKPGTASLRLCTSDCCGQPVSCDLNRISVAIWGPGRTLVESEVTDDDAHCGSYTVKYSLVKNGKYTATVKVCGKEISHSPLVFHFPEPRAVQEIKFSEQSTGFLGKPWGICLHKDNIIVADRGTNTVQTFDQSGRFIKRLGTPSQNNGSPDEKGEFFRPTGVAVDSRDRVIITDKDNHRVKVYNSSGKLRGMFGEHGKLNNQFNYPIGVAVNERDDIFVADSKNNRIVVFTKYFVFQQTKQGFKNPRDVACIKELLVVGLFDECKVIVYKQNSSNFVGEFGYEIIGRPQGIAVDVENNILVVQSTNFQQVQAHISRNASNRRSGDKVKRPQITVFEPVVASPCPITVQSYTFTSKQYSQFGLLDEPCGACITPEGKILIVDSGNKRVLIFC